MLPTADGYVVEDYECHEFAALVTLNTQQRCLIDQMFTLFGLLDRHWDGNFARYRVTQVRCDAAADDAVTRVAAALCTC